MIYIIKCAYCGKTYAVDTDENQKDFYCPSCAGANGLDNVKEKFKNKEELEASRRKTPEEIWKDEGSLDAIKSFNMAYYPVINDSNSSDGYGTESDYYTEKDAEKVKKDSIFINFVIAFYVIVFIAFLIFMFRA